MAREIFEVTKDRFHLQDPCCYILQGTWPKEAKMRACLDGSEVKAEIKKLEMVSALERFKDPDLMRGERITAEICLPESLDGFQKLSIYADMPDKTFCWFSVPVKDLEKRRNKPQFFIEEEKVQQGFLRVRGWAVAAEPVRIQIFDENKQKIQAEILRTERVDVEQLYEETEIHDKTGFFVELTNLTGKVVYIVFYAGNTKAVHIAHLQPAVVLSKKIEKYAKKGLRYWRSQGSAALAGKIVAKVKTASTREIPYQKWILRHLPSQKELEKQKREKFEFQPKISIVIPLYKTPEKYLRQLVETVKAQTYPNWELCLSDGSGANSPIAGLLKELEASDERIKVVSHERALQISENTNAGIEIATGDYIAFADHDDELTPNALFECVKAINEKPQTLVIYTDEDKVSMDGKHYFEPNFKPDFSAMSPWGNQVIQKCVHEQDGTLTCKKGNTKLSVEFNGKAHKLIAVPDDFFTNLESAMPGDILKDAVQIANTTDQEAELFFQTNTDGRSEEQMNMLKKVRFEISQNKKILYKGTLDAAELAKARSLGKFKSGQKGRLEFQLEIPREWDNAYALKKTDITWIFAVKENEKKEFSSYESVGSESAGGAAQEKDIKTRRKNPVRTGDDSEPLVLLILLLGSGAITLCIRCFKGGNES